MQELIRRIHIIGGPGNGKSTLARQLACQLAIPVYHLDEIAFEGTEFQDRRIDERLARVHEIAMQPSWITEGIFLGWVEELLHAADVIVWLDNIAWHDALWRIVVRFARYGWLEVQRQRGWNKIIRFRDYRRHLGQLVQVMFTSRAYYYSGNLQVVEDARQVTRAATKAQLAAYQAKVIHCRSSADVERLVGTLGATAQAVQPMRLGSASEVESHI